MAILAILDRWISHFRISMLAFRWAQFEDHTITATCCCSVRYCHFLAAKQTNTHEVRINKCRFYLQWSGEHEQLPRILSPRLWTRTRQLNKYQEFLCAPTAPYNPSIKLYSVFRSSIAVEYGKNAATITLQICKQFAVGLASASKRTQASASSKNNRNKSKTFTFLPVCRLHFSFIASLLFSSNYQINIFSSLPIGNFLSMCMRRLGGGVLRAQHRSSFRILLLIFSLFLTIERYGRIALWRWWWFSGHFCRCICALRKSVFVFRIQAASSSSILANYCLF